MPALTEFSIVTPVARKFAGKSEIVVAPGSAGDFAALPKHAPMLTTMRTGVLRATVVDDAGGAARRIEFAVDGGFVEVLPDKVIVLTDLALAADEVDIVAARADLKRAAQALAQKREGDEDATYRHDVAWAQARIDVTHTPTT